MVVSGSVGGGVTSVAETGEVVAMKPMAATRITADCHLFATNSQ